MTDTAKKRLPFPSPSIDGLKDPAHLYHQELGGPKIPLDEARIGEAAYGAFMDLSTMEFTDAEYDALVKVMEDITTYAISKLGTMPLPVEVGVQDGDQLYTPYLAVVVFQLLAVMAGSIHSDKTHAERFAYMSEFIRSWAAFGVFTAAKNAGLTTEESAKLCATRATTAPAPLSLIAQVHLSRRLLKAEAATKGMSVEDLAKEKLAEHLAKRDAKPVGAVHGDPDDNAGPGSMAF